MTSFEIALDFLTIQSNCFGFFKNSIGSCFWTMESRKFDLIAQSDFFFHIFFSFYDIIRDCFGFFNNSVTLLWIF